MAKLTVRVEAFTPRQQNTLRGFLTIVIPELHLKIFDVTVHEKNESRWIGFPGKAQIDRTGNLRRDANGKILYTPTIEFTDHATRDAFAQRTIAALIELNPNAFNGPP